MTPMLGCGKGRQRVEGRQKKEGGGTGPEIRGHISSYISQIRADYGESKEMVPLAFLGDLQEDWL